uniref:RNA polymerase II elongation factor ELL-like n=1 Tax=Styela clava TaxID=7725 RepID=UPI001939C9BA|nr:RNA polymerase II elongation factor ELL-like [Styela clava]
MPLNLDSGSYGLRQATSSDKTVLLMKLTDTALRIIESYQDNSNHVRAKPMIQFQGNQGFINIPVPGGEKEMQKFSFQVSNLAQSAGDCLQQIRSGGTGRVECLGNIQQKVTVNATDDSYDMTRQRMTQAKKEEQKASTKVIKQPGGTKMGKVYKKTGKGRIMEKSTKRLSPDTRAPTPPVSRHTPTIIGRSSSPLTLSSRDNGASPSGGAPGSGRNKTKPTITLSSSSTSQKNSTLQPNAVPSASSVATRPLWDRVAHILAVRSYKYPEMVIRLSRDKPPDKARLQEILSKVASNRNIQGSGIEYCLLRSNYNSLEIDSWPGYTENERKIAKKKQAEIMGNGENRKRSYTNTLSPPESANESLVEEEYSNPTSKKQRVSHLKGRTSGASSPFEGDKQKSKSPVSQKPAISFGTTKLPTESPKKQSPQKRDYHSLHREERPNFNSHNHRELTNKTSPPLPKSLKLEEPQRETEEEDDFLKRYTPISNIEQRDRYKKDFYAEYQEYLCHHSNVAAVSGRFAELQRKLGEHERGSEQYKAISKQVIQEYKKTKKNNEYHRERERMQFLHRKLQHIKDLVSTFDRHKLASRSDNDPGLCMQSKSVTKVA